MTISILANKRKTGLNHRCANGFFALQGFYAA